MNDSAGLVAAGYNTLGRSYSEWAAGVPDETGTVWLGRLLLDLPPRARILDLGCGPGVPTARRLAERFDVTGVDISERQIALAREAVPGARFVVADMTRIDFPPGRFDAVIALFSLIHIPERELPPLLARVCGWLRPGGRLLATFNTTNEEGIQADWLGVPMFFGAGSPVRTREHLGAAGFEILSDEIATIHEPGEGDARFHWVDAMRPMRKNQAAIA